MFCYPWLDLGGAPNTAITLAKGMKERGHEVVFFTRPGGIYEQRLRDLGIPVVPAPYHRFIPHLHHLNLRSYRAMVRAIDEHSIDLIHSFHYNHYYLALFAAAARNIPVVYSAVWFIRGRVYPRYRGRVSFVAEEFLDDARSILGDDPMEMTVIPNRIDLEMFNPGVDPSGVARKYGLPEGEGCRVVFMSRVDPLKRKSLLYAIEAVRQVSLSGRKVDLVIAGDGVSFGEISARADEVNAELGRKAVTLTGAVVETPGLLSWSDIVIGIGRCAWEGMATGRPVLVVGENGLAGVVEPGKVDELKYSNFAGRNLKSEVAPDLLAAEIVRMIDDADLRGRLSEFSRRYVMDNYDYRMGAERFEELYGRALGDPPLSRGDRISLFTSCVFRGYMPQLYTGLKLRFRRYFGRGRPEDRQVH